MPLPRQATVPSSFRAPGPAASSASTHSPYPEPLSHTTPYQPARAPHPPAPYRPPAPQTHSHPQPQHAPQHQQQTHQHHPQQPHQQQQAPHQQQQQQRLKQSIFSCLPPEGDLQRLSNSKRDKETYEDMSAVFSILSATERLENIWARRGTIDQLNYEQQCEKLIQQYNALRHSTEVSIPNLDTFITDYECKAKMARPRLKAGVPATIAVSTAASGKPKDLGKYVMRCTSLFYQLANCLDLKQNEVNMLLPDLSALTKTLDAIGRITTRGQDFQFKNKLSRWRDTLTAMPAHAQLSSEDTTQLKLDLDTSFQEFESVFND